MSDKLRTISVPLTLINMQEDGFHIIVETVVFGLKLFAVVDTGASRSVFDKSLIAEHLTELTYAQEIQATTLFGTSSTMEAVIPLLKLGRLKIKDYPTIGLDLKSVSETYEQLGYPAIAGIIGCDILRKYQAVINCKKMKLYLHM